MPKTLYMVVEHFKNRDAVPVYRRFRECGRMAPDGVNYISSWVDESFARCYQLMEADNLALIEEWTAAWQTRTSSPSAPWLTTLPDMSCIMSI